MPWKIVDSHSRCPASKPYAVVNKDTGRLVGCHASQASAKKQMAALQANVGEDSAPSWHLPAR